MPTLGGELEKPISDITTGLPAGVSPEFFSHISAVLQKQTGDPGHLKNSDKIPDVIIGVQHDNLGEIGLDNGTNLQETAIRVIDQPTLAEGLAELGQLFRTDLVLIQQVLAQEGLTVINMSNHPLGKTDKLSYDRFVAPKTIYKYIQSRGWDHQAGIDAKAQNSPATGVAPENAAAAVTVVIGAGAAIIGLFGNSPFSEGEVSNSKESRLNIWDRMMKNSLSEGDRVTARYPDKPFNSLSDYFQWMFGPGTNMHFVISEGGYKSFGDSAVIIDGNPSVLDYLKMPSATGHRLLHPDEQVIVTPHLSHMESNQFAQFTGARIRWSFSKTANIQDFLKHLKLNTLEEYFTNGAVKYTYIEGRDPGANYPDRELQNLSSDIAWSAVSGPSAIQAGLVHNLSEAGNFIGSFNWQQLGLLRTEAIKHGLDGRVGDMTVFDFTSQIVQIAARGLPVSTHHMLAYPEHVLSTHQNGADRALSLLLSGLSLQQIVKSRNVVV